MNRNEADNEHGAKLGSLQNENTRSNASIASETLKAGRDAIMTEKRRLDVVEKGGAYPVPRSRMILTLTTSPVWF